MVCILYTKKTNPGDLGNMQPRQVTENYLRGETRSIMFTTLFLLVSYFSVPG